MAHGKDHAKLATYVRLSTNDGSHLSYEVQKLIQCKCLIMDKYSHEFFWTGKELPEITSDLQVIEKTIKGESQGDYDKAVLKFKTPLVYNDISIIQVKLEIEEDPNDKDHYLEQKVDGKIQFINFRVELRHLDNNHDAKILKKRIGAVNPIYEKIGFCSLRS